MTRTPSSRGGVPTTPLLLPLLAVLLTACSYRSSGWSMSSQTVTSTRGAPAGGSVMSQVNCVGDFCTVTLTGRGATARLFGETVVVREIRNGRATLDVNARTVSCGQGEDVPAGRLSLHCTAISGQTAVFTALRR
jgi:hypothetical protein